MSESEYNYGQGPQIMEPEQFYVFALSKDLVASVHAFPITKESIVAIANIARTEQVLAIIKGTKIRYQLSSVVTINSGLDTLQHALIVAEDANGQG